MFSEFCARTAVFHMFFSCWLKHQNLHFARDIPHFVPLRAQFFFIFYIISYWCFYHYREIRRELDMRFLLIFAVFLEPSSSNYHTLNSLRVNNLLACCRKTCFFNTFSSVVTFVIKWFLSGCVFPCNLQGFGPQVMRQAGLSLKHIVLLRWCFHKIKHEFIDIYSVFSK